MRAFRDGDRGRLVETTVVEVGWSPERPPWMADHGTRTASASSQMHKRRGPGGRGTAPGRCLLGWSRRYPTAPAAGGALDAVARTWDGFETAQLFDLEMRREGDIWARPVRPRLPADDVPAERFCRVIEEASRQNGRPASWSTAIRPWPPTRPGRHGGVVRTGSTSRARSTGGSLCQRVPGTGGKSIGEKGWSRLAGHGSAGLVTPPGVTGARRRAVVLACKQVCELSCSGPGTAVFGPRAADGGRSVGPPDMPDRQRWRRGPLHPSRVIV